MATPSKQVVLITGCSSGIGKATALAFQQAGYITYATARRPDTLKELADKGIHTLALDVTNEDSMVAAVKQIEAAHGAVAILVNNAGYGEYTPLEELSMESVRRQFETNVFGLIRMCQLVLPGMRRAKAGCIINLSSMGGQMALPLGAIYHGSKFAVEAISDVLRVEVKPFGIRVVIIEPGFVRTRFNATVRDATKLTEYTGPYAGLKRGFVELLEGAEGGAMSGSTPEQVAAVIVKAAQASRPRARYKIGMSAYLFTGLRRWLPTWGWDMFVRRMIPAKG